MARNILYAALAALPITLADHAPAPSCDVLTAREVRSMGNNTLFTRWRPYSHVTSPAGWMNDPCGPMYDPTRDIYHVFYQWHPQHVNWGNISWGYATSKDLITFTDHNGWENSEALALGPTGYGTPWQDHYNGLGIFSGTGQPVNLQGEVDGTLLLFYTSVPKLPISWTIDYTPYSESQSLAYSTDGGATWQEYENNPVITTTTNQAPMNWNVTGFRDPFLEPFPALDAILGVDQPHYYAVFGSGIKGVGPRIPLWTAPANDLTSWTFLGALWEPEANSSLGPILSTRTYGYNFEVSGFFDLLDSAGNEHWFVNMGVEGGNLTFPQTLRSSMWNGGSISRRENGSAQFNPEMGGLGDWGWSYALTSFNDTKNNRRVQLAWVPEEIVGDEGTFSIHQQGFQGSLALFRELFVHEADNVVDSDGALADSKSALLTDNGDGTSLAQTLGVRVLPEVLDGLHWGSIHCKHGCGKKYTAQTMLKSESASSMHLHASVMSATGAVGLVVGAAPDMSEYTHVIFEPSNSTLSVVRDHSSTMGDNFGTSAVIGYFAPYVQMVDGKEVTEEIVMDVILDGSLLEVYLNDRFALATRIYPASTCSTGFGVYVEDGAEATFSDIQSWTGLYHIWTDRPEDSSSPLIYDTAEETNNYTWWPGY